MIISKNLDCGVRIVMEEIPYVRSVSMGIWIKTGSVNETAENSGISHFIEHMFLREQKKKRKRDCRGCRQDRRTDECLYWKGSNLLLCKNLIE